MYGWQRFLSIEQEFKEVRQYVPYELMEVYSEFFTRQVILLGAEIEAALKQLCKQTDADAKRGNIGQIKDTILKNYPGIVSWKCTIKVESIEIIPFEGWNEGPLEWWDIYSSIKHNLIDKAATYRIAIKMLAAYELLLIIISATNPERKDFVDKALSGSVWNEIVDGEIKAHIVLEMPDYLIPDIEFGVADGINGLPGIAFYPEDVLNKIAQVRQK